MPGSDGGAVIQSRDEVMRADTVAMLSRRSRSLQASADALEPSGCPERAAAALLECAAILADAANECRDPIEDRWAAEDAL